MNSSLQTLLSRLRNRLLFRWRRDQLARELEEELSFHFEQQQTTHTRAGISPESAAEFSKRQLGNTTLAKEQCRDMWSFMSLERLSQDLRFAFRMYGRTPVFTGISVLSLALGIGGNAAMFSLVNTLLIRPLPYTQPDRLVRITGVYPRAAVPFFQARSHLMDIASVSKGSELNLIGQGPAVRVVVSSATPNLFSVLGVTLARGRGFRPGDDSPGRDHLAILSEALWRTQFGNDPAVLGRVIRLNGVDREIVGIMPAGFNYPSALVQLWIPMRIDPANFLEYWAGEYLPLIGRLRPGATLAAAVAEVHDLVPQFRPTFPYPMARDYNADSAPIPLQDDIIGSVRGKLIILLSAVALVLFIACANVASLLLSRATTRRTELALRAALGAGRLRMIRQLLTESLGLALTGAALGIVFGTVALKIFKASLPPYLPGLAQTAIDWHIAGFVTALAIATGLASGLAPALSASQVDLADTMKTGSQRTTSSFWTRVRSGLIAGEVALTILLLISAGLLLKSLYRLSQTDPGFNSARLLTVRISPDPAACRERRACVAFYDRLLRGAGNASVRAAALANSVPLDGRLPTIAVDLDGYQKSVDQPAPLFWFGAVSPQYFGLMHIPLLEGRYLERSDGPQSAGVAVVSASTAKRYWPHESAIGKHVRRAGSNSWLVVVGVVSDVHQASLRQSLPAFITGAVYMPYTQSILQDGQIPAAMDLLVSVDSDTPQTRRTVQQMAVDLDRNAPVNAVQALDDIVSSSFADFRSTMRVFVSFASVAMLLAAVGIYGLMSYWVSQRTYEIGLRVAVGATRRSIVSLILAQGMKIAMGGVVAGILAALLLTRFLAALLYGVAVTDGLTFAAVTGLILAVALIATAFPAWKASRIEPMKSLRVVG